MGNYIRKTRTQLFTRHSIRELHRVQRRFTLLKWQFTSNLTIEHEKINLKAQGSANYPNEPLATYMSTHKSWREGEPRSSRARRGSGAWGRDWEPWSSGSRSSIREEGPPRRIYAL